MTNDQMTALAVKGLVATLPKDEQSKVQTVIDRFEEMKRELGETSVVMAIAVLGSTLAAAAE